MKNQKNKQIKQGDIWIYTANDTIGHEQGAENGRCCVIVQSNIGNKLSETTIICPLTKQSKTYIPQHHQLYKEKYKFLTYDSLVLNEQIRCIDIKRLERKLGCIDNYDLIQILNKIEENF